jgi:hypothetical protein
MASYKKARGLVVSYAYNTYGLYDTITAADMVDVRLCQLAEEYNLTDKEINKLINNLNKIVCSEKLSTNSLNLTGSAGR